jgi:hypothetical protein
VFKDNCTVIIQTDIILYQGNGFNVMSMR